MERKINIRPIEEKDLVKLPEFLSTGFPGDSMELWESRFKMWWEENPLMDSSFPKGWILEKDRSTIVGFLGNIPVKFQIKGRIGIAVASSSWYVKPEFQGLWSIKLMHAFLKQENVDMFLSTTPVENVEKIMKQFGFSSIGLPYNNKEFWYLIDYNKVFDVITYKLSKSHKILRPFMKIISFKLKIISGLKHRNKKSPGHEPGRNDYDCSLCTTCDDSFSELWQKNRKENTTTLCRDAGTLNWLYFADAVREKRYVIKCTHKPSNMLVGYAAFDLNYYRDIDVRILKLKDFYFPEIVEPMVFSLLASSIELAKELRASGLRLWAMNQNMERILKKKIKIRRKSALPYYYKFKKNIDQAIHNDKNHEFIPSPIDPNRGTL